MRRSERPASVASFAWGVLTALVASMALAATGARAASPLAPEGDSHVSAAFGRSRVDVDLTTHAQAIAGLAIHVDGYALAVPPEAWADLGGPASADLSRREDGRFVLRLEGGTPSAAGAGSWVAELVFDRLALRGRRLLDPATGQVRQDVDWGAPELLD